MVVAVALWSVVVKPGEPLEIEPPADLRITNVALSDELEDPQGRSSLKLIYRSPSADDDDEDEDDEDAEDSEEVVDTVLCSLTPGKIEQTTLDLVFEGGVGFALEVTGKNSFHLTGNYIDQAGFDQPPSDLDDDEDDYDLEDVSSDVEIDPAELDIPGDDEDEGDSSRFEEVLEEDAKSKKRPRDSDAMEDVITAVVAGEEQLSKAQKKKLNKKLKATDGTAVAAGEPAADTPPAASASAAPSKKEKKKAAKDALKDVVKDAAKAGAKEGAKEVAKESAKESAKSKAVEELSSGVKMIDSKAGTGKTAKKGNTVSMRYIGKLQNGKVFDSNTKGKPFTFNLGKGEVIKGWDEGIVGMAVGGERVLTIPPAMAYGKRGAGKDIPPNSTLTFEVKLLEIK